MRFCELKEKEVVNICNGKCLGGVVDLLIPFACIKKIGPDIILVEIKEEKFLQKY